MIELGEDVWQQWMWLAELEGRSGDNDAARAALQSARQRAATDEDRAQIDSVAVQLPTLDSIGAGLD